MAITIVIDLKIEFLNAIKIISTIVELVTQIQRRNGCK